MCSECGNEYSIKEYEELQAENEKLKGELACAIMSRDWAWDENSRQKKKNEKLRCLALHAMSELFYWLQDKYFRDGTCALSWEEKEMLDKRGGQYLNLRCKYLDAYRKAKKELMEGK